jgi:hypothetical protein
VLVVGASATGIQLADEIHARAVRSRWPSAGTSGCRAPTAAATSCGGSMRWASSTTSVDSGRRHPGSRRQPSLQLVGRPDQAQSLDVGVLHRQGVRLVGTAAGGDGTRASVRRRSSRPRRRPTSSWRSCGRASTASSRSRPVGRRRRQPEPFEPTWPAAFDALPTSIDLRGAGIRTVVWATGFRVSYPWLQVPVLDRDGEIRHEGGVTPVPGLYVLGLHFQRRRKSASSTASAPTPSSWPTTSSGVRSRSIVRALEPCQRANEHFAQDQRRAPIGEIIMAANSSSEASLRRVVVGGRVAGARRRCCWRAAGSTCCSSSRARAGPTRCRRSRSCAAACPVGPLGAARRHPRVGDAADPTTTFHYGARRSDCDQAARRRGRPVCAAPDRAGSAARRRRGRRPGRTSATARGS